MPDLNRKRLLSGLLAEIERRQLPTVKVARIADRVPQAFAANPKISVHVFAAAATDPGARSVADALKTWGGRDGRLHIRDPFAGVAGGGQDYVFDVPSGATHVQVFFQLTKAD